MSTIWPLRFRHLDDGRVLISNDTGTFFLSQDTFLKRYATNSLTEVDLRFLKSIGNIFEEPNDPEFTAFSWNWTARHNKSTGIQYLILVPTLRCNLACDYCQVSRAAINAEGYDWSEDTLQKVLSFIGTLSTTTIKIEFQGGEPLLRLDLLLRVVDFCRRKFERAEFIVCTNLQHDLSSDQRSFLRSPGVFISTSLDGEKDIHTLQRTKDRNLSDQFYRNLDWLSASAETRTKLNALATIDVRNPPEFESLIREYEKIGQHSIFFRPINYQGFARRGLGKPDDIHVWNSLYRRFVHYVIARNFKFGAATEEHYLTLCLRRVMQAGIDSFVDLRNPNIPGSSYLLVDYDGKIYPSDEARMLARIGYIDLSIGDINSGVSNSKFDGSETHFANDFDPDCVHCAYQPYCGVDFVDDVSRYGRVDLPRHSTWFCQRQTDMFDLVFELLYSNSASIKYSLTRWLGVGSLSPKLTPTYHDPPQS